jgi:hypothetical protein
LKTAFEIQNGRRFQWAVTLLVISISLMHCVCVENEKKMWNKFFHFGSRAPLGQAGGWKWFFGHNFESIQLFTCHIWNMREVLIS